MAVPVVISMAMPMAMSLIIHPGKIANTVTDIVVDMHRYMVASKETHMAVGRP